MKKFLRLLLTLIAVLALFGISNAAPPGGGSQDLTANFLATEKIGIAQTDPARPAGLAVAHSQEGAMAFFDEMAKGAALVAGKGHTLDAELAMATEVAPVYSQVAASNFSTTSISKATLNMQAVSGMRITSCGRFSGAAPIIVGRGLIVGSSAEPNVMTRKMVFA